MFHLNWRPLPAVIGILAVEIFIGACVRDAWVRPYAGDVLAVVLVYASLRMVLAVPAPALAAVSFLVGAVVEAIQYLGLPEILGFARHPLLAVVVGSTFGWEDLVAYAAGALIAWLIDAKTRWWSKPSVTRNA